MGKRLTDEERIAKFHEAHNSYYLYDRMVYIGPRDPIEIGCPEHGYFWQSCNTHMSGSGCPECGKKKTLEKHLSNNIRKSQDSPNKIYDLKSFIQICSKIHNNKFGYLKSVYTGYNKKIIITCPIHGEFETTPRTHFKGHECKKCSIENSRHKIAEGKKAIGLATDTSSFIFKAKKVHSKSKYGITYGDSIYVNSKTPLILNCPIHGQFYQAPDKHLVGHSCPKCRVGDSSIERKVSEILDSIGVKYVPKERFKQESKTMELDFFIPDKNIGIEVNGCFVHSSGRMKKARSYHREKREFFSKLGIRVIFIWSDELRNGEDLIISYLKNTLVKTNITIYARNCSLREITNAESNAFLNSNHILRSAGKQKTCLGLFFQEELLCVMTFNPSYGKNTLTRMANKLGHNVVGGFSKLLYHWRKNNPSEDLISFIDMDKFTGHTYFKNGFIEDGMAETLWYVKNDTRHSKFKFRKNKLRNTLKNFDESKTEKENCRIHNIFQAWNSGTMRVRLPSLL